MAANGTPDLSTVLDQLGGSLDSVQAALEPLLARPLEETLAELPGPIERAKVLFWIAYTIHSCSWGGCAMAERPRACLSCRG